MSATLPSPHPPPPAGIPLKITIIGAGIAGLTCALALHHLNPHHYITILEKSQFAQEIGAALYVAPNCSGLLRRIGVDLSRIGGNLCEGVVSVEGRTGGVRARTAFAEMSRKWANPWMLAHRRDLHLELKRAVEREAGVRIELGVRIVGLDIELGRVVLDDGRVVEGDAIVGADGNNSFSRRYVWEEARLKPYGKNAYRWLVDREELEKDREIEDFVVDQGMFVDFNGVDRKIVQYPCRDNTVFNFVAFLPEDEGERNMEEWERQGNKTRMINGYKHFAPSIERLLSHAGEDLKMWSLVDMDALPTFNKGRLALIGDAAHPFLPFLGQGAAQAMEDSISMALCLSSTAGSAQVPDILKVYDSARRERVELVRDATRTNGLDEDKGKPPVSFMFNMLDNCYSHDEWSNTCDRLEEWRTAAVANGVR